MKHNVIYHLTYAFLYLTSFSANSLVRSHIPMGYVFKLWHKPKEKRSLPL